MKTYNDNYRVLEEAPAKEPRFVVQVSWDKEDTDHTYFTSSPRAMVPVGTDPGDEIIGSVSKVSGQTQKINPDLATSTIGAVKVNLLDVTNWQNLHRYSNEFTNAAWTKLRCSITAASAIGPDGTFTGSKIIYDGGVDPQLIQGCDTGVALAGRTFTFSIWAWTDTGEPTEATLLIYDASIGDVGTKVVTLTTTPKRYSITHTFGGGESDVDVIARFDGPNTVAAGKYQYIWGSSLTETSTPIGYSKTGTVRNFVTYPAVSNKIASKLSGGDGLRQKIVRIYVGYADIPFTEYNLRLTYLVDSVTYKDGMYTLKMSDLQRQERHKIFTPKEATLAATVTDSALEIPVNTIDLRYFPALFRGISDSVSPGQFVGYVKIEDEVIQHRGMAYDATLGYYLKVTQRGALNTRPAEHRISDDTDTTRAINVVEHIYLEGPTPKIIYALLTGIYHNGTPGIAHSDIFDLDPTTSNWTASGPITVTKSTVEPPSGWGTAYTLTDDNAGSFENLQILDAGFYNHGETWGMSAFIKKEAVSAQGGVRLRFMNGAAGSECDLDYNLNTGVITNTATVNAVTTNVFLIDHDENWWFINLQGYSTTTGTTAVRIEIYARSASAALTGDTTVFMPTLLQGSNTYGWGLLPKHWHLGIDQKFVKLSDFYALDYDHWRPGNDTGKLCRIENPDTEDGKRFIESQILLWMGCFMPIYSDGSLGIRKLAKVLPYTSYHAHLNNINVISYSDLVHDMKAVINDIRVKWNWVDSREDFTKENIFIDSASITKHQIADTKSYSFKTVHTGVHTDEDMLTYFDTLRDRYAGPPLKIRVKCKPSSSALEVGDRVRLSLPQVRNFTKFLNNEYGIDRVFEVQQVTTDWTTGNLTLTLFGSSQKAGEIARTSLSSVLLDTFYTNAGTNLTSVLTIVGGAVTANGTLTGNATNVNSAIYYYDGDLTINAGVTVTITENVQLRVKGVLTINGSINGVGNGATGGAATTQYVGGGTTDTVTTLANAPGGIDPLKDIDFNFGEQGYFGNTVPQGSLGFYGQGALATVQESDNMNMVSYTGGGFTWYGETVQQAISEGIVQDVPFFNLSNDQQTQTVAGYPLDLRGNSGGGGVPLRRTGFTFGAWSSYNVLVANGGAGGDGGAGLLIISRGVVFGGSGKIDLSGGPSSPGGFWTSLGGDKFYAGSGAPGAPGALVILLDGAVTNPDIDSTNFVANFGDAVQGVGAQELCQDDLGFTNSYGGLTIYTPATWPGADAVFNCAPADALENISATDSAHRVQYIPADLTPEYSDDSAPDVVSRVYKPIQTTVGSPQNQNLWWAKTAKISGDNQRIAISEGLGGGVGTPRITIYVGLENLGVTEHTINIPAAEDSLSGEGMGFNDDGSLFFEGRPEPPTSTFAGKVYIWKRTGTTWANVVTINHPTANEFLGESLHVRGNGTTDGFFVATRLNLYSIQYREYDNAVSAPIQQTLTNTKGTGTSLLADGNAMAMSANAQWFVAGDEGYSATGSLNHGCALVYERTGSGASTWTERALLTFPIDSLRIGQKVAIDGTGQTIAASAKAIVYTPSIYRVGRIDIWQRDGEVFKHLQTINGPGTTSGYDDFGKAIVMSDDGLTLAATMDGILSTYPNRTVVRVYKRGSKDVKFKLFDEIICEGTETSYDGDLEMSFNGNYLIFPAADFSSNGTNKNGILYIFENQFQLIAS